MPSGHLRLDRLDDRFDTYSWTRLRRQLFYHTAVAATKQLLAPYRDKARELLFGMRTIFAKMGRGRRLIQGSSSPNFAAKASIA